MVITMNSKPIYKPEIELLQVSIKRKILYFFSKSYTLRIKKDDNPKQSSRFGEINETQNPKTKSKIKRECREIVVTGKLVAGGIRKGGEEEAIVLASDINQTKAIDLDLAFLGLVAVFHEQRLRRESNFPQMFISFKIQRSEKEEEEV